MPRFAIAFAAVALAPLASAQVEYVTVSSTIDARAVVHDSNNQPIIDEGADAHSSPSSWSGDVDLFLFNPSPVQYAWARSTLDSTLGPDGFEVFGRVFVMTDFGLSLAPLPESEASFLHEVTFRVDRPSQLRIHGDLSNLGFGDYLVVVESIATGAEVLRFDPTRPPTSPGLTDELRDLPSGEYRATLSMDAAVSGYSADGKVVDLAFDVTALAWPECTSRSTTPQSPAPGIEALGSASLGANDLSLRATAVAPSSFGLFFAGASAASAPFGPFATLCIGGPLVRVTGPRLSDPGGGITAQLDLSAPAFGPSGLAIAAGEERRFQFWFRDPAGPVNAAYNTTDAVRVRFRP